MHDAGVVSIGDFSRLTHLSVRTLRRYHDAGLLTPATVDDATGYRYYDVEQIPTAQVILRLRELEVPLSDVQRILRSPDPATRAALVADHLRRLEAQLDRTRAAVASLQRLLRPETAGLEVELREVPATTVAAIEDDVDRDDVLDWYAGAMAELDAVVAERTGSPGGCTTTRSSRPAVGAFWFTAGLRTTAHRPGPPRDPAGCRAGCHRPRR